MSIIFLKYLLILPLVFKVQHSTMDKGINTKIFHNKTIDAVIIAPGGRLL